MSLERLREYRHLGEACRHPLRPVAGGEDERNLQAVERIGDREYQLPRQIDIEYGAGEVFGFDRPAGLSQRRAGHHDGRTQAYHKLLDHHKDGYALDWAAKAGLLADDKKAFRSEPWVEALVKRSIEMAKDYDAKEQWLKALRVYSDLSSIEQANPEWKEKLKLATRRIRLLALYTPGGIKSLPPEAAIRR